MCDEKYTHSVEAKHEKDHQIYTTIHYNRKALVLKMKSCLKRQLIWLCCTHYKKTPKLQKPNLELSTDISFLFKVENKVFSILNSWRFPDTNLPDLPFRGRKIQTGKAANLSRLTFWKLLACFKQLCSLEYYNNPNAGHLLTNYRWGSQKILELLVFLNY